MSHQLKDFESSLALIAKKIGEAYAFPKGGAVVEARQIARYLMREETQPLPLIANPDYSLVWTGVPASNSLQENPTPISVYYHKITAQRLGLTPRQVETAACLVSYDTTQSLVGQRLGIPQGTAKNRLTELYGALKVNNQTQAAVKSLRTGLFLIEEIN